ncbi:MAG: hypothetical protein AAGM21_00990 [Pseudomonadota bacterium]
MRLIFRHALQVQPLDLAHHRKTAPHSPKSPTPQKIERWIEKGARDALAVGARVEQGRQRRNASQDPSRQ